MSEYSIYQQASKYTMDTSLQSTLLSCAKGKFPPSFKVSRGKIITAKGNTYVYPRDPMDMCNLIHDIVNGNEKDTNSRKEVVSTRPTRSTSTLPGIRDDEIYAFAEREAIRLQKDKYHEDMIRGCIFTALFLKRISFSDFELSGEKIVSIRGINTDIPCIERKED